MARFATTGMLIRRNLYVVLFRCVSLVKQCFRPTCQINLLQATQRHHAHDTGYASSLVYVSKAVTRAYTPNIKFRNRDVYL